MIPRQAPLSQTPDAHSELAAQALPLGLFVPPLPGTLFPPLPSQKPLLQFPDEHWLSRWQAAPPGNAAPSQKPATHCPD